MNEQVSASIEDGVATLALDRPDALNAITVQMLQELAVALDRVQADPLVDIVVLTGAGRAFSAGVDLKSLGERELINGKVGDVLDLPARAVISRITGMSKIVLARVNGFCFTGALELALACDLIVAADEAKFGDTHAKFGLRPTWGMSQRLIGAVGLTTARRLSYTAETFTGRQAAEWGLATTSVPLAELDAHIAELTGRIRANSAESLAAYKVLFDRALNMGLDDGLRYEADTEFPINDTNDRLATFR